MGEIWRARHSMLTRPAAIKLIRREHLGNEETAGRAMARFEREAQATARLSSPHTVRLYDYGVTEDGALFYVMELLEGMNLNRMVETYGAVEPERAVHFLLQACRSLAEAHDMGLIHRDIKPGNLFACCRQGIECDFVKVLDFGLVRPAIGRPVGAGGTFTGIGIVGTPAYISPEGVSGAGLSAAADLYSLGCVGYWLVTGHRVFEPEPDSDIAQLLAHLNDTPVPPSRVAGAPEIPGELEKVILQCLAKDPAARPGGAREIMTRLSRIPLASPWTPERAAAWWAERSAAAGAAGATLRPESPAVPGPATPAQAIPGA